MSFDRRLFLQFSAVFCQDRAVEKGSGEASAGPGSAAGPTGRFGLLLRRLRQASRLTQEELAARSGLSVRAVAAAESGRTRRPHRHSAQRLAGALGLAGAEQAEFLAAARGQHAAPGPGPRRGSELRELQQQILGDYRGARPGQPDDERGPAGGVSAGTVVPRELPGVVGHFTGREGELTALSRLLDADDQSLAGTVVISAIGGTAGVGKTALAIRWAHQVADRFGDGQLYVNLRGYDPDQPVTPADALAGFLRALGVPGQEVPDEIEERARLYRSRLAGRRVLVVLDNARDGEQVRPLLPGEPGCLVLITSRDVLSGLVATNGARRLDLDVLPLADAVALLRSLIGARVDEDLEAAAELAGLCARLPLALRIAAELAAARPETSLRALAAELELSRLDCLDGGEDRADLRAVFSWSYRHLDESTAGAFALLGLHPGADLDVHATAALTRTVPGQADRVLGRLHRASLVQAAGPGRYEMHDLLRAYAREQARTDGTEGSCHQALTRLFDYYLAAAAAAMDILFPAEAYRRPRVRPSAAAVPAMPDQAAARAWLDTERANLVAVVAHCAGRGWPWHATCLASTLRRYLMTGSHLPQAHTVYGCALQAARGSGDLAAEAEARNALGTIALKKGRSRHAAGHYKAALQCYRQCGDRGSQARVLSNLGMTDYHRHDCRSSARYYRQAIAAYDEAADHLGAARALASLAAAETELGCYDQAAEHLRLALPVLRQANDQVFEAEALSGIGELALRRRQLQQAAAPLQEALAIYRSLDHPAGIASVLRWLGDLSMRQGRYQQAIGLLRQALTLHVQTGDRGGEIKTLRILAEVLHGAGQPAAARAELETALDLAAGTGNTYQQASVHRDLADSHHSAGRHEQARHHWQQALDLYTQLGAPEADQIRTRLSAQEADHAEPRAGHAAS
jgi:tetratricopeptide (TPR) repeat protein/transcriptional regulator with XRE-family HTH domain